MKTIHYITVGNSLYEFLIPCTSTEKRHLLTWCSLSEWKCLWVMHVCGICILFTCRQHKQGVCCRLPVIQSDTTCKILTAASSWCIFPLNELKVWYSGCIIYCRRQTIKIFVDQPCLYSVDMLAFIIYIINVFRLFLLQVQYLFSKEKFLI